MRTQVYIDVERKRKALHLAVEDSVALSDVVCVALDLAFAMPQQFKTAMKRYLDEP